MFVTLLQRPSRQGPRALLLGYPSQKCRRLCSHDEPLLLQRARGRTRSLVGRQNGANERSQGTLPFLQAVRGRARKVESPASSLRLPRTSPSLTSRGAPTKANFHERSKPEYNPAPPSRHAATTRHRGERSPNSNELSL